jgi:hypothetical protein
MGIGDILLGRNFMRGWLVSRRAPRLLYLCAIASIATLCFMVWLSFHPALQEAPLDRAHLPFRIVAGIVALPGVFGSVIIWLAMWRYWITLDDSSELSKRRWFLVLLFGLWYGSCLYYFLVYRGQVLSGKRSVA